MAADWFDIVREKQAAFRAAQAPEVDPVEASPLAFASLAEFLNALDEIDDENQRILDVYESGEYP